jgi:hypothetical protein
MGEVGCGDGGGGRGRATEVDVVRDREGDMHGKSAKKGKHPFIINGFVIFGDWSLGAENNMLFLAVIFLAVKNKVLFFTVNSWSLKITLIFMVNLWSSKIR